MKIRQIFSILLIFSGFLIIVLLLNLAIVQEVASASASLPEDEEQDLRNGVFTSCNAVSEIPVAECEGLVALYEATGQTSWTNHNFWKISDTPCSWYGVTCESGHVTFLNLDNNNLVGTMPSELGNLVLLQELNLGGNMLSGNISTTLGGLTELIRLNLSDNQLTGTIPAELGNLASLKFLFLNHNQLSGAIPTSLGNLSNLITLNLGYNQLSGGIPPHLGLLTNLQNLSLSGNPLGGEIPAELANLSNLSLLSLREDQLTGNIPPWLGSLSNLFYIELNYNQLEGMIPAELGNIPDLFVLYLHGNNLVGSIPASLGNLEDLVQLYLSKNQLTGTIPPELGNLSDLVELGLCENQLTGAVPSSLGNLVKLKYLYLWGNQFSGNLPPELGNLRELLGLYLYDNEFSGPLPAELTSLLNLTDLYYHETSLCAPADVTFQTWLSAIPYKSVTWNCLAAPTKTSPVNNAFTRDPTPKFTWQKQMDGEKYQIMVDNNADFSSPEFNVSGLVNPSKTFTTALVQGAYYWKVRAQDPGSNWSPWSTKWKFTVDTTPPGKPVLLSPTNGSQTTDRTPTFTWKAVAGAKYYQLVVDDTANFSSPVYTSPWLATTSKTLSTSLTPKLYYWQVRAKDAAGNIGAWSLVWKVTIK